MQVLIDNIVANIIQYMQSGGILIGIMIIILESIIPILPLGLFVAFNIMAFGKIMGFLISYIATIIGCLLAYFLIKYLFANYIKRKAVKHPKLDMTVKSIRNIKFNHLVLVLSLPFTPAFLINIAAGLVKYDVKRYVYALLISKISIIIFWGYVGSSAITNIGDPKALLMLGILLIISYFISKTISKRLKIE